MGPSSGALDQRPAQLVVDLAKTTDAQVGSELVEHACIGNSLPMGKPGERAPGSLLGQQCQHLVEGVDRRQNSQ